MLRNLATRMWRQDEGVLTFEWILLVTLLVIGIVGGIAAVRDGIISELGDVATGVTHFNQSFTMPGNPEFGIPDVQFEDETPRIRIRRGKNFKSQGQVNDSGKVILP